MRHQRRLVDLDEVVLCVDQSARRTALLSVSAASSGDALAPSERRGRDELANQPAYVTTQPQNSVGPAHCDERVRNITRKATAARSKKAGTRGAGAVEIERRASARCAVAASALGWAAREEGAPLVT